MSRRCTAKPEPVHVIYLYVIYLLLKVRERHSATLGEFEKKSIVFKLKKNQKRKSQIEIINKGNMLTDQIENLDNSNSNNSKFSVIQNHFEVPT